MVNKAPPERRRGARTVAARPSAAAARYRKELQASVETAANRLLRDRTLRAGAIVFRDPSDENAVFSLRTTDRRAELVEGFHGDALLEISGDPRRLRAILEGRKDAREQFYAGGISVRGDMRYLSELGLALGFLKTPLV
jgi:hypothetical protein